LALNARRSQSNAEERDKSEVRASDLNMMTERGDDDKDASPKHSNIEQSIESRNQAKGMLQFDSTLSGLVLAQRPTKRLDSKTEMSKIPKSAMHVREVQLSEECRADLGLNTIGLEDELINLRIKPHQLSSSEVDVELTNKCKQQPAQGESGKSRVEVDAPIHSPGKQAIAVTR